MALCPEVLLSSAARSLCTTLLKETPSYVNKNLTDLKYASVLVPLCEDNGEVCLLYTLRSQNLSTHKGQVSFPGGKQDQNENVFDTALRETEEEIGIPRKSIDIWAEMNPIQGRDKNLIITPIVGQLRNFDIKNIVINTNEVDEVFTVPMSTFCDSNNHAHFVVNNLPLPIFLCGKHKIWGITGMITHLFLLTFLSSDVYKPNFMRKLYVLDELLPAKL